MSPCLGSQSSCAGVGPVALGQAAGEGVKGTGAGQAGETLGVGGAMAEGARRGEGRGGPVLVAGLSGKGGGGEHTLGNTWEAGA